MATCTLNPVIDQLRRAALLPNGAGLTDGQLLESFISRKDEGAFEVLMRRHGSMVQGVCRRVLRNHHDAEDAFQATFLVLVRKAGSIVPREMVANWLYGVAYRTALKARSMIARKRVRERQVAEMPEPETAEPDHRWRDLRPLLDKELTCLPDKYRTPIVLCDLEGKAGKDASRQLGWPEGTVASRLSRGRAMLSKRLTRHGLALSGGSLVAVLSQNPASASVPISLISSTVKAASYLAAGQALTTGLVSAKVTALMEGVVKAMLLNKLKMTLVSFAVIGVVGTGLGGLSYRAVANDDTARQSGQQQVAQADLKPFDAVNASKEEAVKEEKKILLGVWKLVSCETEGEKVPEKILKGEVVRWTVTESTIKWTVNGEGKGEDKYRLEPTAKPKAIDLANKEGRRTRGIYLLEQDALKVCINEKGQERPKEFASRPNTHLSVMVFQREKQDQTKQILDMILKGRQAYLDSKGKKSKQSDKATSDLYAEAFIKAFQISSEIAKAQGKVTPDDKKPPVDQELARFLWEIMEKSYRHPEGKQAGPAGKEMLDQYREAFFKAFQISSDIAKAKDKGHVLAKPHDEAIFDAYGPAFVQAYERAKTLKMTLEEQKASNGKENDKAIEALGVFLKAGNDFEQAVKVRAKTQAVEHAKKEIEDALSKVQKTAHDRQTMVQTLDEIEKAVQDMKMKVQEEKARK
jgi:RNA polymerase sigma factor (sigma-70 family)